MNLTQLCTAMCLRRVVIFAMSLVIAVLTRESHAQEQLVDPTFRAVVQQPAYSQPGPTVAIDEAHSNFHKATGQYQPFAELLTRDGYTVKSSSAKFESGAFAGIDILVIANALPQDLSNPSLPAFTEEECDVVQDWVRSGGSLLLIADHAPFGGAAENLAGRFGVAMGKGWAFDRTDAGGITTQLTFSRQNDSLGTHAILRGRVPDEEVGVIRSFTGQSLSVPDGAVVLMPLRATVREALTPDDLNAEDASARNTSAMTTFGARSRPATGRAQGIAMTYGNGRVVVLGEAGMLSAQLVRFPDGRETKFGMNVSGSDNQQFALNVLHWLSGLLN
jgi:hypothetical protein